MRTTVIRWVVGLGGLAWAGCGVAPERDGSSAEDQRSEPGTSVLSTQGDLLSIGAEGEEVRAVHRYLREFGYLPNEELKREFPQWRSPVSSGPAREDVYDAQTEEAVRAFQRSFGLFDSGLIDDESREIMLQKRCGVPELPELDESNKFDVQSGDWASTNITWRLMNANGQCDINAMAGCITKAQAESAITQAFASWQGPSRHTFTKTTGAAVIEVRFSALHPDGTAWNGRIATGYLPAQGGDLYIDGNARFSVASTPPSNAYDLQTVVVHELGHTLGILHSSVVGSSLPVMYPSLLPGIPRRALTPDDNVAALVKGGLNWLRFDSTSYDIDVDGGPTWQHIYVTADPPIPGGYTVWRLDNGSWGTLDGQGAVRIASNGGVPWIVRSDGANYSWNPSTLAWVHRPGCATDIAVGGDNSVWKLGCVQMPGGGYRPYKWNGASWDADFNTVGGVRITVGPRDPSFPNQVQPWVVRHDGHVLRRNSNDITTGTWHFLPTTAGVPVVLGTDIAASTTGNVWMIGTTPREGGFPIYAWNEQSFLNSGGQPPAARARWISVPGAAINVTVDRDGYPYVVNSSKSAYHVN
jgi:peptidoglycan hydrolase-like protein with peptidoglycan-binding domain